MYDDFVNVEQGPSKHTTDCSNDVNMSASKSTQKNIGPNKANSGYTSDTGLYVLDTHNEHNSSIASIKTDNLREGLKSIDNPIFEVVFVGQFCHDHSLRENDRKGNK